MTATVTLYTGEHCHLCHEARALILGVLPAGWTLREVSITGNTALQQRYGVRIPVMVTADGEEKGWPFSAGQVKKLISN